MIVISGPVAPAFAQEYLQSIHQIERDAHRNDPARDEGHDTAVPSFSASDAANAAAMPSPLVPRTRAVTKKVFGYHPYWASASAYLSYDYASLSSIGYFSYDVDTATGGYITTNKWMTTPIISYAHERGVKVVLVVTNFGSAENKAILSDTSKQNVLISTLVTLLIARAGDGVDIDFEGVPAAQRANLVSFMRALSKRIKAALPAAEISMATPAVDWSGAWDLAALAAVCDHLFLMGYNYYWSGSSTAGPVSALEGESYNETRSVTTYVNAGVPPEKLILGVAWYGYDWPVVSQARKAATAGSGSSGTYAVLEAKAQQYGKQWDAVSKSPWFSYQSGSQWRQAWYDDSLSLSHKYAMAKAKNLAGIGMWALSYEGRRPELWQGIRASFSTTSVHAPDAGPGGYELHQNFPNPFNPTTRIRYAIPVAGHVSLKVFDVLGREVAAVVNGVKAPGAHDVEFHAGGLPSGVYFCRMASGPFTETTRLVLQR